MSHRNPEERTAAHNNNIYKNKNKKIKNHHERLENTALYINTTSLSLSNTTLLLRTYSNMGGHDAQLDKEEREALGVDARFYESCVFRAAKTAVRITFIVST
jgi:hypothetical protein